jgi:hypothetical protein
MPSEAQGSGGAVLDALDVALLVAAALDQIGCEYFVGGSVASSLQGEPRATNDIDFVVAMMTWRVPAFAAALGADFEVDQETLRDAVATGRCANIFYLPLVMKVDLFGLGSGPYDEVEFSRRRRIRVKSTGEELFVKSPEDTVLRKLLWYRDGGEVSTKQWRDIVEVLRVSGPQIDHPYVDQWASRLGVAPLLVRAQSQAEGGPPPAT